MTMTLVDRRTFMATVAAAYVAAGRLKAATIPRIGVQLYTVRDAMQKDFDGTIAKVAAIGYKEVEFAGYFDRTPQQVRDVLKNNGLTSPAAHIDYPSVTGKWPAVLDAAKIIGHKYLVNPWIDESIRKQPDSWKRIAEEFNKAGEASKKVGIQFCYHNHNFEYAPVDGKEPYDILLENCDPKLVKMELDLAWITVAGKDPLAYFKRYPGRFPMVHVKGVRKLPPAPGASAEIKGVLPDITDVGSNDVVDWKRIFAASNQAGIEHYFVEHDVPPSPFDSLKTSFDYLSHLQF
jgi:sugar phosphate isomerase/epimerase